MQILMHFAGLTVNYSPMHFVNIYYVYYIILYICYCKPCELYAVVKGTAL